MQALNKILFGSDVATVTQPHSSTFDRKVWPQGTRVAALAVVPSENVAVSVSVAPDTNSIPP